MATQPQPTMYANWEDSVRFGDQGPATTTLLETPHLRALLVGLRADQMIPMHPSPEAIYHFLQGTGTMTVDDERYPIQPGATIVVPDGAKRGITADGDIVFIGTTRPADPGHSSGH